MGAPIAAAATTPLGQKTRRIGPSRAPRCPCGPPSHRPPSREKKRRGGGDGKQLTARAFCITITTALCTTPLEFFPAVLNASVAVPVTLPPKSTVRTSASWATAQRTRRVDGEDDDGDDDEEEEEEEEAEGEGLARGRRRPAEEPVKEERRALTRAMAMAPRGRKGRGGRGGE